MAAENSRRWGAAQLNVDPCVAFDTRFGVDELPLSSVSIIGLLNNWEVFGQERANIEVFKCLRALGANVAVGVTTMGKGGEVASLLRQLGFETFDLPFGCHWSKNFFRRAPLLVPKNLAAVSRCSAILEKQIKVRQCSLLLLGNPLVYSFVSLCLMRNRKLPMIYRMGDEPPSASKPNLWIWKRCFRRAKGVVANSKYVQGRIACVQADSANKVRLIYNVAPSASLHDQANFDPRTSAETDRESLRVLYVGQISEHKGVSHLLNAALTLCPKNRHVRFDFVGGSLYTGPLEEQLKNEVIAAGLTDQIEFHGRVSDPLEFYQRASVLVVPSLFEEPAANVVLEAKRLGVPAIVYPSGGLPELVQHGVTGLICHDKSASGLLEHLKTLLDQPETFHQMKDACLQEYERRFSEDRFRLQWLDVVKEALVDG
jgi:glycosyltransferase involved in cell wall biosynthesis